jgi:putative acetyltransferase
MSRVRIRTEEVADREAVEGVLRSAFPTDLEARLVAKLRGATRPQISLVAEHAEAGVVGQILFTPVEIRSPEGPSTAIGLGPMAVEPDRQQRGVGSALVAAGLRACAEEGEVLVVVLGHPSYCPRFGFGPAWDHGLYFGSPGPSDAFMVLELAPGGVGGRSGEVVYHHVFYEV